MAFFCYRISLSRIMASRLSTLIGFCRHTISIMLSDHIMCFSNMILDRTERRSGRKGRRRRRRGINRGRGRSGLLLMIHCSRCHCRHYDSLICQHFHSLSYLCHLKYSLLCFFIFIRFEYIANNISMNSFFVLLFIISFYFFCRGYRYRFF